MTRNQYLTAQEAADELDVSLATLYSYVSRGLVRSEADGEQKRNRRYRQEDVQHLKERKEQHRDPGIVAERALHLGAPVLESAITLITDDRFYYRGRDVLTLATSSSVEQVAALLWLGEWQTDSFTLLEQRLRSLSPRYQETRRQLADLKLRPLEAFQVLLPLAAIDDIAAYNARPAAVAQTGMYILRLLVGIAVDNYAESESIAQTLQRNWTPQDPQAALLFSTALILAADHELNVASFTARCVASAGANPYAVVTAGLSALQGARFAGYSERIEAFLDEAATPDGVRIAITNRLKRGEAMPGFGSLDGDPRGESVPGFGHTFYTHGDPRGKMLLELTAKAHPHSSAITLATAATEEAQHLIGELPNFDFGLAILARVLNLPAGAAIALFALGRTIGWIGHAIEQYQVNQMIRPRARYVGVQPEKAERVRGFE